MVFGAFYDFDFFSRNYPYHRDWIGFSYAISHSDLQFNHYIVSHGSLWEITVKVADDGLAKDVYDMIICEVMRKRLRRKEDIESTSKKGYIIAEKPARDLTVDELYELIINHSIDYLIDSVRVEYLLNGPRVSANEFADHINHYLRKTRG